MKASLFFCIAITGLTITVSAQNTTEDPKATEIWTPEPRIVRPGLTADDASSDAIILFNGKNLNAWVSSKDTTKPAGWTVANGAFTVKKGTGNIQTKRKFLDYQLHIEWRIPKVISGSDQAVATAVYSSLPTAMGMRVMKYRCWIVTIIKLMSMGKPPAFISSIYH